MNASKTPLNHDWLPKARVEAIVCHWNGGTHTVSSLDRADYHFIIEGDLDIHRGNHSIAHNIPPLKRGSYAPHTRGFNAYNGKAVIGVALCGMGGKGVSQKPVRGGEYPITKEQVDLQARVCAQLCFVYGLEVTPQTVLQHGEVQKNRGKLQLGKWDVCAWPWAPEMTSAQVCDAFRALVAKYLVELQAPPLLELPRQLWISIDGKTNARIDGAQFFANFWHVDGTKFAAAMNGLTGRNFGNLGFKTLRSHLSSCGYVVMNAREMGPRGDALVIIKAVGR